MKTTILLGCLLFITAIALGQEKILIKQTTVKEAVAFELGINPDAKFLKQNVSMSSDYYPYLDKYPLENPMIVERKPIDYLPLYADYYYTSKDSLIRIVSYDWEMNKYQNYFEKIKTFEKENKKFNRYNNEYERIKKHVISTFGKPLSEDKSPNTVKSQWDSSEYLNRKTVWENDELHAELDLIFASNTHRIRLTYYWKDK